MRRQVRIVLAERVGFQRFPVRGAPMWELNYHSPQLLADRGFLYDSSLMDADVPYELAVDGTRSIVEIPIQWALDDWEQYCYIPDFSGAGYIASPPVVLEMWSLEFEAIRAEGGCFVLTKSPLPFGAAIARRCARAAHGTGHRLRRRLGDDDAGSGRARARARAQTAISPPTAARWRIGQPLIAGDQRVDGARS
jgi:hypothetical protein